jgi:hypothetical protein
MSVIVIVVVAVIVGVAIGLVYNKLVIKDYPPERKKGGYVVSVIVFLLISLALFGVLYGRLVARSLINDFTQEMAQQINTNHAQNSFVKNGVNLKNITTDAAQASAALSAVKLVLPSAADLGIPKTVYDIAINYVMGQMQTKLMQVKNSEKFLKSFAEDDKLTVSSLTNGIRQKAFTVVNVVTVVFVVIFVILLGIYIFVSLSKASKQRKKTA